MSPYFFFFHDPAPTEVFPLSLHDALPISLERRLRNLVLRQRLVVASLRERNGAPDTEPTAAHASRAGPRRDRRRSAARAAGRASAHRFAPAERPRRRL